MLEVNYSEENFNGHEIRSISMYKMDEKTRGKKTVAAGKGGAQLLRRSAWWSTLAFFRQSCILHHQAPTNQPRLEKKPHIEIKENTDWSRLQTSETSEAMRKRRAAWKSRSETKQHA